MHQYGTTWQQFAAVALNSRRYAATNPNARYYGRPLSMEEYEQGRMVADPLRIHDCCLDSDGAAALVITGADRARDGANPPAYVMAVAQGMGSRTEIMPSFNREDITVCEEVKTCADELWKMADIRPRDGRITLAEWLAYGSQRVPRLAREIARGKLPALADRGLGVPDREESIAQQPSLFDFTRDDADVVLAVR